MIKSPSDEEHTGNLLRNSCVILYIRPAVLRGEYSQRLCAKIVKKNRFDQRISLPGASPVQKRKSGSGSVAFAASDSDEDSRSNDRSEFEKTPCLK